MIRITLFVALLLCPLSAYSIVDLVVKEKLAVYKRPKQGAKKISQLSKGDVVVISSKSYGEYRKVLVTYNGKRQGAYILKKDIVLSVEQERAPEDDNKLIKRKSAGGTVGVNYTYISAGKLMAKGFPDAKAENMFGFDFLLGAHFNLPIGKSTILELSATKRSISISGDVEFIANAGAQSTDVIEKGYSAGAFVKFYGKRSSFFYKGLGVEAFYAKDVEITVNGGRPVPYDGDGEFYFAPILGLGWDIQLTESMFLSPDLKAGGFVTRDPMAIFADFRLVVNFLL